MDGTFLVIDEVVVVQQSNVEMKRRIVVMSPLCVIRRLNR